MDFNPADEQSPPTDLWPTNDGLDSEDAATIASLATQPLQSKFNCEHGDGIEVSGQALVANYAESRSSPQSQYSAIIPTEPAESFRGLMEDHERGAQILEEDAILEYGLEPGARGHSSIDVAGVEEPSLLSGEHIPPDPFRSLLNVADVDVAAQNSLTYEVEMSATMTASHIANEMFSSTYAEMPNDGSVNLQALQLTPPQTESPSVSIEERDRAEQETEPTFNVDEQRDGSEAQSPILEEIKSDIGAQQQLMTESNEQLARGDGKGSSALQHAPRGRGRPRKSDASVVPSDSLPKRTRIIAKVAEQEHASPEADEATGSVVAEGAEVSKVEEASGVRKRGRPCKSEIGEATPSSVKRGSGRPPKSAAADVTPESTPAIGKRGRPRKSSMADTTRAYDTGFRTGFRTSFRKKRAAPEGRGGASNTGLCR
ncbi:hypothetical protein Trco_000024 [Trichoderma cornu-damae]|uniref:Uncharacterized protein n=1 Tax=Trichoderma cornu-damae TaxID=654480 RepID=A0A9P8QRL6_9HYPO|nr:hypothetical protein Trco_000024 [Trichoderma cornu-damae]